MAVSPRDRDGFVLAATLVLMVALMGVFTAMRFVAGQERAMARAAGADAAARLGAQSAVRLVLASWSADSASTIPIGATRSGQAARVTLAGGASLDADVRRLDADRYLVVGAAVGPGRPTVRRRAAALVRSVDLAAATARFAAALEAGGAVTVGAEGVVDAGADARACDGGVAPLAVMAGAVAVDPLAMVVGPVGGGAGDPVRFGFLPLDSVAADADRRAGGGGAVHAAGDLVLDGAATAGVLVVDGNLELRGGATFDGLLIVRGTLVLRDAEVRGAALAGRGAQVDGRIRRDPCAVRRALAAIPVLAGPHPAGSRLWLPAF